MKIIRFKSKNERLIDFLQKVIDLAEKEDIDNIMLCYKDKKQREMYTGYFNMDMGQMMECVGHLQADIMDLMVSKNMDKYIEIL